MRTFHRPDGRLYYIRDPARDLLGDLIVDTWHCSRHSNLGGLKSYVATDGEGASRITARLVATRLKHGYQET